MRPTEPAGSPAGVIDPSSAPTPLAIDRIQSSSAGAGRLRLRLSGRWLGPPGAAGVDEELLVVQIEGQRHRFPASREGERQTGMEPGRWSAGFIVPVWAEPRRDGQAALWLGNAVIPVPPVHGSRGWEAGTPGPEPAPEVERPAAVTEPSPSSAPGVARSGPLADVLLQETVTALRVELERLTGAVQAQRRELDARASEIERERAEADRQIAGLAAEATVLREDLAVSSVSREVSISEVAGLRAELGRLGSELAVTRERVAGESGDLGEANRLLADAKALTDQLCEQRRDG